MRFKEGYENNETKEVKNETPEKFPKQEKQEQLARAKETLSYKKIEDNFSKEANNEKDKLKNSLSQALKEKNQENDAKTRELLKDYENSLGPNNKVGSVLKSTLLRNTCLKNAEYIKNNPDFRETKDGVTRFKPEVQAYIDNIKNKCKNCIKPGNNLSEREKMTNENFQSIYNAFDNLGDMRGLSKVNRR